MFYEDKSLSRLIFYSIYFLPFYDVSLVVVFLSSRLKIRKKKWAVTYVIALKQILRLEPSDIIFFEHLVHQIHDLMYIFEICPRMFLRIFVLQPHLEIWFLVSTILLEINVWPIRSDFDIETMDTSYSSLIIIHLYKNNKRRIFLNYILFNKYTSRSTTTNLINLMFFKGKLYGLYS